MKHMVVKAGKWYHIAPSGDDRLKEGDYLVADVDEENWLFSIIEDNVLKWNLPLLGYSFKLIDPPPTSGKGDGYGVPSWINTDPDEIDINIYCYQFLAACNVDWLDAAILTYGENLRRIYGASSKTIKIINQIVSDKEQLLTADPIEKRILKIRMELLMVELRYYLKRDITKVKS